MADLEGDQAIGAGRLAGDPFPTVEQWHREEPDGATPKCPSCGEHLGIRLAIWNPSGRDEWICDNAPALNDPP